MAHQICAMCGHYLQLLKCLCLFLCRFISRGALLSPPRKLPEQTGSFGLEEELFSFELENIFS